MWYPEEEEVIQVIHPASDIGNALHFQLSQKCKIYRGEKDMVFLIYLSLYWLYLWRAAG
jgi:hypothetical protein